VFATAPCVSYYHADDRAQHASERSKLCMAASPRPTLFQRNSAGMACVILFVVVDLMGAFVIDSDLSDTDNIVLFEYTTLINQTKKGQNKRKQRRLIRLLVVLFSNGTMLLVSYKSD